METRTPEPVLELVRDDVVWVRGRRAKLRAFLRKGDAAVVAYEGEHRWRVVRASYVSFRAPRDEEDSDDDD